MTISRFNEEDRGRVIRALQDRFKISLKRIGHARKYLQDRRGRRCLVLGGYDLWHGIAESIFSEEKKAEDTQLVIAIYDGDDLKIFSGPFSPLVQNKHLLSFSHTRDHYVFKLEPTPRGYAVHEVPSAQLKFFGLA